MNILGDFYEKLPGDKEKRFLKKDPVALASGEWNEETEGSDNEEHEDQPKTVRSFRWLYFCSFLVFVILSGKLWNLQIVKGSYYRDMSEGNRIRTKNIAAPRGIIYDRNGKLLVKNLPSFNIEIYPVDLPKDENERNKLFASVARHLKISKKEITDKVNKKGVNPLEPIVIKEKILRTQALIFKEKFANVRAVAVTETSIRSYDYKYGLAHLLGYVGKVSQDDLKTNSDYYITDNVGKVGLEATFDSQLRGINGKQQIEVDAEGEVVRIMAERQSTSGKDVVTTIDYNLQKKIYEVLENSAKKKGGKGTVVAVNPQNGEILAMVSLPSYNNNIFTKYSGNRFKKLYKNLLADKNNPMFNRAISGVYPVGSTIKPLVASAALQDKVIDINTHINDPGVIEVPNKYDPSIIYKFHCWKLSGHGWVNVIAAIRESCDTFFYAVGGGYDKIAGLGIKKLDKFFNLFGLGDKTGIDLTSEGAGLVPDPEWKEKTKNEPWYLGDNYMLAIGQGDLLLTPLQLLMGTSVIANKGSLLKPQLVKEIKSENKSEKIKKDVVRKSFVSAKNLDIVRQGMREVVLSGTARALNSLPVSSAGKTGTAEFNNKKSLHAWYTAFAPYENPEIALVVLVEGGGEGNEVAVPIAKEILNYYFRRK